MESLPHGNILREPRAEAPPAFSHGLNVIFKSCFPKKFWYWRVKVMKMTNRALKYFFKESWCRNDAKNAPTCFYRQEVLWLYLADFSHIFSRIFRPRQYFRIENSLKLHIPALSSPESGLEPTKELLNHSWLPTTTWGWNRALLDMKLINLSRVVFMLYSEK